MERCEWTGQDPLMIKYHDKEWGVPVHNDNKLFEFLILDAAQAGLSWQLILKKRDNFRRALDNFNAHKIAKYGPDKVAGLLNDSGIIRNRLKISSFIKNAQAFLHIQEEFGRFDTYIWQFVNGKTIQNQWQTLTEIPARSAQSDAMSKDMKKRDFFFVGTTICYAFMQAAGLVNDHIESCFRYHEIKVISAK